LKNFSRRTITGIFIVITILGGIWLHPVSYIIIGGLLLTGSIYEYYRLISHTGLNPQHISGIITTISVYIVSVLVASGSSSPVLYLIIILEIIYIIIVELFRYQDKPIDNLAHTVFGIVFISVPFSLFPYMAYGFRGPAPLISSGTLDFSPGLMIGILLLSWSFDTGAYLFGSWFGRNKLMERISPDKSWEGFIFGLIVTILIAWPVSLWIDFPGTTGWIIIGILISVTGTLGDLVESMLKRKAGVKDSGSLLPGHGGLLDRFDSLILSLPVVFIYLTLFG